MLGPLVRGAIMVGITVPWSIVALFIAPFAKGRYVIPIARLWARQLVSLCGVKVEVVPPKERLDGPAYLVMSNHTSHFDVPSLYSVSPIDMRPVAKKELGSIPIFGWALRMGAAIMIDRKNSTKAHASIEQAAAVIRSGISVLMFPEGTRTPNEELGPLKKGAFHLAQAARVPVLPVAVLGTKKVLASGDWKIRPGRVQVRYGRTIRTDDLPAGDEGRQLLMDRFRAAVAELVRDGQVERDGAS